MASESAILKPKRHRWLQFSLRTFFILMTIACLWLGWQVQKAREQREAVAAIREMGGKVTYDYEVDEVGRRIADAVPSGPNWLREVVGVDFVDDVVCVELRAKQVSDVTCLAGLTRLRWLYLYDTQVSDITPLAKLTSLRVLSLVNTHVTDVTPLGSLTSLQWLTLSNTPVSDVTPLAKLTNLELLFLSYTKVSDVTPVAKLTSLEQLYLSNTQFNDVTSLTKLATLEWLDLTNTPVSEDQVTKLRKALPNCKIRWSPSSVKSR